jgi:hypothetical protein
LHRIKGKLTDADRSGALCLLAHNPKVVDQIPPGDLNPHSRTNHQSPRPVRNRLQNADSKALRLKVGHAASINQLRKASSVVSHLLNPTASRSYSAGQFRFRTSTGSAAVMKHSRSRYHIRWSAACRQECVIRAQRVGMARIGASEEDVLKPLADRPSVAGSTIPRRRHH